VRVRTSTLFCTSVAINSVDCGQKYTLSGVRHRIGLQQARHRYALIL